MNAKSYIMNTMETREVKTGLVIMASGLGKRFGSNKLIEPLGDKPIIKWIIDTTEGLFDKRVVVTRSIDIKSICDGIGIDCILHEFPGRNDTVRLGLSSIISEIDYCFFTPSDQPLISRDSIIKMIDESKAYSDRIIRACYGDLIGTPTGFPKIYFNELLDLPEGKGGNWIVNNHKDKVYKVFVGAEYELIDIDTVQDLDKIKRLYMRGK